MPMMDHTVPWVGLVMRSESLDGLPEFALPPEYGWRGFMPGDEKNWVRIAMSAGEFETCDAAIAGFRRYFPADDPLDARMLFLTDGGVPFATATAWFGEDDHSHEEGRLHWVAVDEGHQRRRLSYPLVSLAMRRLRELGHRTAYLTTQTASWPAIKVYRHFGFSPLIRDAGEVEGWRIVSEKTGLDFLKDM